MYYKVTLVKCPNCGNDVIHYNILSCNSLTKFFPKNKCYECGHHISKENIKKLDGYIPSN